MSESKFDKPWKTTPSKLIALALEFAEQKTDAEQQVAFLLLDVGVETALKTYLTVKKQEVKKLMFAELIKKSENELKQDGIEIPFDKIEYFHKIRNKLYHEGDGVKPTDENLQEYSKIAKALIKTLFEVDIENFKKPEEEKITEADYFTYNNNNIFSIISNSILLVETQNPHLTTQKTLAKLREIDTRLNHSIRDDPFLNAQFAQDRLDEFNQVTGWDFGEGDLELVDELLMNPELLPVLVVFNSLYKENCQREWETFKSYYRNYYRLYSFKEQKDKKAYQWILEKAEHIYKTAEKQNPDVLPIQIYKAIEWQYDD